ncbi:MAG: glycosyltransferase family A protein, partial [Candidatus Peribacteraceae bacterium]|nr:glycosyltransferase family A protein [Candidatus Peribacteraceae bacterium]
VGTARETLPAATHTISIVIPAHNEEQYLGACLESIVRQRTANAGEIIVVDNASTDGTARVAGMFAGVTVVREDTKGLTHARQRGLLRATGDLLAYIDADTRVQPHWFDMINRTFAEIPALACLSGPYEYFDISERQQAWVKAYWRYLAQPTYAVSGAMVVGGNFVARRDALLRMGGFDTSIAFYGEDTNIARRLRPHGLVKFDPAFTIHSSGRRLAEEGMWKSGFTYGLNYVSELLLHKPFTTTYRDIR